MYFKSLYLLNYILLTQGASLVRFLGKDETNFIFSEAGRGEEFLAGCMPATSVSLCSLIKGIKLLWNSSLSMY